MRDGSDFCHGYGQAMARRRLGTLLRAKRDEARITLEGAATRLEFSSSTLARIEAGQQGVDVHLAKSMIDLYDLVDEYDEILELARNSRIRGWWVEYGIKDRGYIGLETDADSARTFESALIPGLMQTRAYARALFEAEGTVSTRAMANEVDARMVRQLRLRSESRPLRYRAVVHEAALRCLVGGVEVMYEQLAHLAELAELPTVDLRVVPFGLGAHAAMYGPFTLLGFPHQVIPDILYAEHAFGSLHTEKPHEVSPTVRRFERLCAQALDEKASLELIQEVAQSW